MELYLHTLRHAKSSWDQPGLDDHARPLAPRGREAARLIGEHMRTAGIEPELILCSTARRARETLAGAGFADAEFEDGLYGATAEALIARLRSVPDALGSVLMVGHNPSIQALVVGLAAPSEEVERVAAKYPTGALATLRLDRPWSKLEAGAGGELVAFVRPKALRRR